ncbi:MAG: DEAD/DEAH box helicase [Verrucomicrobiota bacterium]|nr:DEAD/DEAH box helicase [Verrucomicrobiota bacterium]
MFEGLGVSLRIPDLWQQEAVRALQVGRDVVVQAPTGAGKTYIFELLYPELKGQAVFTVPTRALANDKLAEWRGRGWDVGIATGDLALHLDARVVVATLETQRGRFLRGDGPQLLVIDEFQMLGDEMRGVHYELALALAPKQTQLLLLSGSVANARDVVAWLQRLDRDVELIEHSARPVPLEERDLEALSDSQFVSSRSFWPRMIGRALRADLAPVLIFAPRRAAAEQMAQAIASALPPRDPLPLTAAQESIVGKQLSKLLRHRVGYHHSGLSYAARAGVVEALAKNGQLNVVVATMGLAAGINFSMRSVIVADRRYFAGNFERIVEADELLQMFGRAGRRGFDDAGYALFASNLPRLGDARPRQLKRAAPLDWPSLLSVTHNAAARGEAPFAAAVDLSRSLFTSARVQLGAEHSLATGARPCGLWVTDERARFLRRGTSEMLNSRAEWQPQPTRSDVTLGDAFIRKNERWRRALTLPQTLEGVGLGNLCRLRERAVYGRELPLATILPSGELALGKWLQRAMGERVVSRADFAEKIRPQLAELVQPGAIVDEVERGRMLSLRLDYSGLPAQAFVDAHGCALRDPPTRENLPECCRACDQQEFDRTVAITNTPAFAWRALGLIAADGTPTARGIIFSFFQAGEGLAIAAALEEEKYPIEDLVFDLANLRAGPRFAGEDAPMGGRLGILCQRVYQRADYPGYLAMGTPPQYGAGAAEVMCELVANPSARHRFASETLRHGDIERALMEWRSLLRHIVAAPDFPLARWQQLKVAAAKFAEQTTSPALADLPPLLAAQQRRA